MDIEVLIKFLAWSSVVNIALLLWWSFFILLLNDFTYGIHNRMFKVSREAFNAMHYGGIGLYKMLLWMFNLTPYLVLQALY